MDRRGFFKTMLAAPFVAPLLVSSSKEQSSCNVFLITDQPHDILPTLLSELQKEGILHGRSFGFQDPHHPLKEKMLNALSRQWRYKRASFLADLTISFNLLRGCPPPSFTVVRYGRIWDVRTRRLYSLWEEMLRHHKPSSLLTALSLEGKRGASAHRGAFARIFLGGCEAERLPLNNNLDKSYSCRGGEVSVRVQNGQAWVVDSSCWQKICLHSSPASVQGDRIICAPNHFLLEIQGAGSIDTIIG